MCILFDSHEKKNSDSDICWNWLKGVIAKRNLSLQITKQISVLKLEEQDAVDNIHQNIIDKLTLVFVNWSCYNFKWGNGNDLNYYLLWKHTLTMNLSKTQTLTRISCLVYNCIFSVYWWWFIGSECTHLSIEIIFLVTILCHFVPQAIFGKIDYCKSWFNLKFIVRLLIFKKQVFVKCRPEPGDL